MSFSSIGVQLALHTSLTLLMCVTCEPATAQGTSVAKQTQTSNFRSGNVKGTNTLKNESRDPLGNRCLLVEPLARPHVANPNIYDQVLVLQNQCLRLIKIRACYTESDRCVDAEVPGLTGKELVLGISPTVKFFSYDFREF
jgi:hypothetical protein